MAEKPILVLQLQRLGDLILTFPLLLWLQRQFPKNPIWVAAERSMFEGLMPLSPQVTFFPREALNKLQKEEYHLAINLSHRPEAAHCLGKIGCEQIVGPYIDQKGNQFIAGKWQLYRASLVHNNRHNLFHWADLHALDCISPELMAKTTWPYPESDRPESARIGLFLGASEETKRPTIEFWSNLTKELLKRGLSPLLLGGPAEKELGEIVSKRVGFPQLNWCGKFSLLEFSQVIANLRTLVTPDTGPMHLAAWTRTPTLNLSMGPVNPWETGPYQPGHNIIRTHISCTGCWRCKHPTIKCRDAFFANRIAAVAHSIAVRGASGLSSLRLPKQTLYTSARDAHGLFTLHEPSPLPQRQLLALFWKAFFCFHFSLCPEIEAQSAWKNFTENSPKLVPVFRKALKEIGKELSIAIRHSGGSTTEAAYWATHPPCIRPLTGYIHMLLQNGNYARSIYAEALSLLEKAILLSQ